MEQEKLYEFWIRPAKPGPKGKATQIPQTRLPCFKEKWFFYARTMAPVSSGSIQRRRFL